MVDPGLVLMAEYHKLVMNNVGNYPACNSEGFGGGGAGSECCECLECGHVCMKVCVCVCLECMCMCMWVCAFVRACECMYLRVPWNTCITQRKVYVSVIFVSCVMILGSFVDDSAGCLLWGSSW